MSTLTNQYPHRRREARRTGARILDTAEGVLAALRRYRVDKAFIELMQTAKRHGVNPVSLADALVALAEEQSTEGIDDAVVAVARAAWGHLLGVHGRDGTSTRRRSYGPPAGDAKPKPAGHSLQTA